MPRTARRVINEDHNTGNPAATVPTGLPYGENQARQASIAAAPIPQGAPVAQPGPPPGTPGAPSDPIADAQNTPFSPVNLFAPTANPGEPVTAGLPSGPGPGPEALMPQQNPDTEQLKQVVPLLEVLASGPNSTYATRNFLRTLRSSVGQ